MTKKQKQRRREHKTENAITISQITKQQRINGGNLFHFLTLYEIRTSRFTFLTLRFMQDSSGTTLMDLITADPTPLPASSSSSTAAPTPSATPSTSQSSTLGKPATEKRSKRSALMQIQNDTISAAKAAVRTNILPQKQKKKVPRFHPFFLIIVVI